MSEGQWRCVIKAHPPHDVLEICSLLNSFVIEVDRIFISNCQIFAFAGVWELTFPSRNEEGNDRFIEFNESTFNKLRSYCLNIERLFLSGTKAISTESLYLKIVLLLEEEDNPLERYKYIYNKVKEAEISCVQHYYEYLEHQYFVIISEKAECDLKTYLETNELSLEVRINLCVQYAELVLKLHEQNIVHCDLKPSNVLVLKDGSLRLTDFEGSSYLKDNKSFFNSHCKSIGYFDETVSVEQFQDLLNRDLFALGISFIEIFMCNPNNHITTKHEFIKRKEFAKYPYSTIYQTVESFLKNDQSRSIKDLIHKLQEVSIELSYMI